MRFLLLIILLCVSAAPGWAADVESQAICTFTDQNEVSVRYNPVSTRDSSRPQNGKVWAPGGSPLLLFAQTPITVNNVDLPVGAYSLYLIPNKSDWTLIVNKNVNPRGTYSEKDDLVRTKMESAPLGSPSDHLNVSFGRIAPKQCELRVYYDKIGTWATLSEK
jgi:hypothetical protein